jgi:hypothetical protein
VTQTDDTRYWLKFNSTYQTYAWRNNDGTISSQVNVTHYGKKKGESDMLWLVKADCKNGKILLNTDTGFFVPKNQTVAGDLLVGICDE